MENNCQKWRTRCDVDGHWPDYFPTLCSLAGLRVPRSIEGRDLSRVWRGDADATEQDAVFMMNFSAAFDWLETGLEWRGVRTKIETYTEWLDGRIELFDLATDPLQRENLAGRPGQAERQARLQQQLRDFQQLRGDELVPVTDCDVWFDNQRRVVRNGYGELSHPESTPDWSLLR